MNGEYVLVEPVVQSSNEMDQATVTLPVASERFESKASAEAAARNTPLVPVLVPQEER